MQAVPYHVFVCEQQKAEGVPCCSEGTWYSGVQRSDVAEIVESHFRNGRVVERLVNRDAGALQTEIAQNRALVNALREKDASGALPDPLREGTSFSEPEYTDWLGAAGITAIEHGAAPGSDRAHDRRAGAGGSEAE